MNALLTMLLLACVTTTFAAWLVVALRRPVAQLSRHFLSLSRTTQTALVFAGDGASNLADPTFVAKAGETNRVTLLVGKEYLATCALPFEIVGTSSASIEVGRPDGRCAESRVADDGMCGDRRCQVPIPADSRGGSDLRFLSRRDIHSGIEHRRAVWGRRPC